MLSMLLLYNSYWNKRLLNFNILIDKNDEEFCFYNEGILYSAFLFYLPLVKGYNGKWVKYQASHQFFIDVLHISQFIIFSHIYTLKSN